MSAPTPEPNAGMPIRTEVPKPVQQPTRPHEETQSKTSEATQGRVQEKKQQIIKARETRAQAERAKEQRAQARAEQQARQKTDLGVEDIKHPLLDESDAAKPSTESVERQTMDAIAEGNIPPPSPKLQRIIYHVCKEFKLDPTQPADVAKVQKVVQHLVHDSKLYAHIQDGKDLDKAMRLAQVTLTDVKEAYQRTYGVQLQVDSVEQISPENIDELARVIVAFEDVTTSAEYIERSYQRMNRNVKSRYLLMFANKGATEQDFDKAVKNYTDKALDAYPENGLSIVTLQRYFYGHDQEQVLDQRPELLEAPKDINADISHDQAIALAEQTHAYIEHVLTDVTISGQAIRVADITAGKYSESQLAQAFIENAEKTQLGAEPTLERNQEEVTRQVSDITFLLQHTPQADHDRIQQELTILMTVEKALQRALTQTRTEGLAVAA